MKEVLKKLHRYYYLFCVAFFFILLYPFIYWASRPPVRFHTMNRLRYFFSSLSSYAAGIFYRYHSESPVDWSRSYIICANHTSNLDVPALIVLLKRNFVFMGKDELLDNFVTGIYFRTIDIPLNRDSKMSAFRAFKKAGAALAQGKHLVIFPEGMISEQYPPSLQPFKNGPFKLAIEHGVPILPVTISNSWKRMWDDGAKYGTSPGICDICIHPVIETAGLSADMSDTLKDQVYQIISRQLEKF